MYNIVLILVAVLFSVLHSVMASLWFKCLVKQMFGETFYQRWYTLIYSSIAVISLWGIMAYSRVIPDQTLWDIKPIFPLRLIQWLGVGIFIWASMAFDLMEFLGINQALARKKTNGPRLVTSGVYQLCRHPLYLGIIIFLWGQPHMGVINFILALVASLYLYIGSILEEKKLVWEFGDEYFKYKQQTPQKIFFCPWRLFRRTT
jgi:protein-S-isoprenylcysteine O-methyltransferase Ste14